MGALHLSSVVVHDACYGKTGLPGVCDFERVRNGVPGVDNAVCACVDCLCRN